MEREATRRMARELLDAHGLADWKVAFDRAKRRGGQCRFETKTISLSGPLTALYQAEDVREVILHEIAHALAGPAHGHDEIWRELARKVGARPRSTLRKGLPKVEAPWKGYCPNGHEAERFRAPSRVYACRLCDKNFDPNTIFTWYHLGKLTSPGPKYERELKRIKRRYAQAPHRDSRTGQDPDSWSRE